MTNKLISIVMPVFNEELGLEPLYRDLNEALENLPYDFEFIFVNDGSSDGSLSMLMSLRRKDVRVRIINFSRNFGQQNALKAGMDNSQGDAVVLMDSDLEDNPKAIKDFIKNWEEGYDVVYAKRCGRKTSFIRKTMFGAFHALNNLISDIKIDRAGIFCLMDKKVTEFMKNFTERDKYLPGLRSWVGFKQIGIEVNRGLRYDKTPRVKMGNLFKLALDSFISFSAAPLKVSMFFGFLFSALSFAGIVVIFMLKIFFGLAVQGWASLASIILFIGGVQLICIGLLGEYIARIFNEVKKRPDYIISDKIGFEGHNEKT